MCAMGSFFNAMLMEWRLPDTYNIAYIDYDLLSTKSV